MKKLFYFAATAALVFGAAACNGNKENVNEQGLVDDGGAKLTPDQQKSKIEETADALMSDLDLTVWQSEYDLVNNTIQEMQDKDVDASSIQKYLSDFTETWTTMESPEPHAVYNTVMKFSDVKGHFIENANGSFEFAEADDFRITIYSGGKTITATASVKDRDEKILLLHKGSAGTDGSSEDYNEYLCVPEKANLGIVVDGKRLAELEIRLNYTDANKDGRANEYDKFDLGYTMTVGAYSLSIDQADYSTSAANVKLNFSKDSKLVLGVEAQAALGTREIQYDNGSQTELIPVSANAKIDLEGKIQLVGSLPSYDYLENAQKELSNSYSDFEKFKVALDKFEKSFGIGLYYDGTNTLQATLGFEPVNMDAAGFSFNPVIRFADGTSYTAEAFAQKYGQNLAAKIEEWADGILDYLGLMNKETTAPDNSIQ